MRLLIIISTTVRSYRRRECMIMAQDSICRISEDGVWLIRWRNNRWSPYNYAVNNPIIMMVI